MPSVTNLEEAKRRVEEYRAAITRLLAGEIVPSDFPGWTDPRFHGMLAFNCAARQAAADEAGKWKAKYDTALECLERLGKGLPK